MAPNEYDAEYKAYFPEGYGATTTTSSSAPKKRHKPAPLQRAEPQLQPLRALSTNSLQAQPAKPVQKAPVKWTEQFRNLTLSNSLPNVLSTTPVTPPAPSHPIVPTTMPWAKEEETTHHHNTTVSSANTQNSSFTEREDLDVGRYEGKTFRGNYGDVSHIVRKGSVSNVALTKWSHGLRGEPSQASVQKARPVLSPKHEKKRWVANLRKDTEWGDPDAPRKKYYEQRKRSGQRSASKGVAQRRVASPVNRGGGGGERRATVTPSSMHSRRSSSHVSGQVPPSRGVSSQSGGQASQVFQRKASVGSGSFEKNDSARGAQTTSQTMPSTDAWKERRPALEGKPQGGGGGIFEAGFAPLATLSMGGGGGGGGVGGDIVIGAGSTVSSRSGNGGGGGGAGGGVIRPSHSAVQPPRRFL